MEFELKIYSQKGSFIVESVWLWPVLMMLTLGLIQSGFLYNAKATMNNATFQSAREGAIEHANKKEMEKKLAYAMAPLYVGKKPNLIKLQKERLKLALAMKSPVGAIGRVDIISPTKKIYKEFERAQYYLDGKGKERKIKQMPNDNLNVRSAGKKRVKTSSGYVKINLQDANLLKVRAYWCFEMIVPFVNYVIYKTYSSLPGKKNPHWNACRALSVVNDSYYLPISASSVVRMQTPIRW